MESSKWVRGDFLGKGGFSRVYSMQNTKTGEFFAGKFSGIDLPETGKVLEGKSVLKKLKAAREMLKKEIDVHKTVKHPNIVSYISSFSTNSCYEEKEILVEPDSAGECEVLVLEICPNKSLADLLKTRKKVTEDEARFYVFHIAKALAYLRDTGIIHRDIKLGNIFLDEKLNPKIGDFGLAVKSNVSDQFLGTPNYVAPEILKRQEYSFPVDTWSLGVCLYALISGNPPFETYDVNTTYQRIKSGTYFFPDGVFSVNAKNLIRKILTVDPEGRISIYGVLEDKFFTEERLIQTMPIEARVTIPKIHGIRQDFMNTIYKALLTLDGTSSAESFSDGFAPEPPVWIQRWISDKSAVAYQYNTGSIGVNFKDETSMTIDPDRRIVSYVKRSGDIESFELDGKLRFYEEKVAVLRHFMELLSTTPSMGLEEPKESLKHSAELVYVIKWIQTRSAFLFRFSNDTLQVNFANRTSVVISVQGTVITYINKNQMFTIWLSEVQSHDQKNSILKLLLYIRDVLKSLLEKRA